MSPPRPSASRLLIAAAGLCLGLAPASPAHAQHGFVDPSPRSLLTRLALADAVAIGSVETIGIGRIEIAAVHAVREPLPGRLTLKRSPAHPPLLAQGQRAVLLLRGARAPYLLVDAPGEEVAIEDASAEAEWSAALRALADPSLGPAALRDLHQGWLSAHAPSLQRAGAVGLGDPDAPFQPLPESALVQLAATAVTAPVADVRIAAARAATRDARGRRALLERVPGEPPDLAVLAEAVLAGGPDPAADAARLRGLAHPDPSVRSATVQLCQRSANPAVRERLAWLTSNDPDEDVRAGARRMLARRHPSGAH